MIFVGDDWAEDHHDVYVWNTDGAKLVARRLLEGVEGVTSLHRLLAELVDEPAEVVVGIETDRGLWVQSLVEAGYGVYAIESPGRVALPGSAQRVGRQVRPG